MNFTTRRVHPFDERRSKSNKIEGNKCLEEYFKKHSSKEFYFEIFELNLHKKFI